MNDQNSTLVQEELERKLLSVVGNQIGMRRVWEHPVGDEGLTYFIRGYSLQRDIWHQLGDSIKDDKDLSVSSRRGDQHSKYINTNWLQ